MARNALSKLMYWTCCHWFPYKMIQKIRLTVKMEDLRREKEGSIPGKRDLESECWITCSVFEESKIASIRRKRGKTVGCKLTNIPKSQHWSYKISLSNFWAQIMTRVGRSPQLVCSSMKLTLQISDVQFLTIMYKIKD